MVATRASSKSKNSSDRQQWLKVFNALVKMLQTQQTQLESLVKERKLVEDRIQMQRDRWVTDVRKLEGKIIQMKSDITEAQLGQFLEVAKSELVVGLKQRESMIYKLKLDNAESDLEDFKLWFELLTRKGPEQSGKSGGKSKRFIEGEERVDDVPNSMESSKEKEQRSKILEGELNKLKHAYEKLNSKNSSEVSALKSERDFVWNQLKVMENNYTSLLKNKNMELEQANGKVEELLSSMEQLQSSHNEKDETIVKLKADLAKLGADRDKSNREISRLSKELEFLRNSKGPSVTPVLNRCQTEASSRSTGSKKSRRTRRSIVKKESAGPQASGSAKTEPRNSRRREVAASSLPELPKLFSSGFKIPKLKSPSLSSL